MRYTKKVDLVYVGANGQAMPTWLRKLNSSGFKGKVTLVGKNQPWPFLIKDKYLRIGQHNSSWYRDKIEQLNAPTERPTVEKLRHDLIDDQIDAIFNLSKEIELEVVESEAMKLIKNGPDKLLYCENGEIINLSKIVFGTGLGPERDASQSGVIIQNPATGSRVLLNEITTGLRSLGMPSEFFKNKKLLVLGGGAQAPWVLEHADFSGVKDVLWVGRDFDGANPGGRNSDILKKTEDCRKLGEVKTVAYKGDPEFGTGLSCIVVPKNGKDISFEADIFVVVTGANAFAPGGVRSILGEQYNQLKPVPTRNGGIVAMNPDGDIIVTTSALYNDPTFTGAIETTYPLVPEDARITASYAVARASTIGAASLVGGLTPNQESPLPPQVKE